MAIIQIGGQRFDGGFQSDVSREFIPSTGAYRIKDFIPEDGAPARKRGGWGLGSTNLNTLSPTVNYVSAVVWVRFAGDPHLVAISDTGRVFYMKNPGSGDGTFVGASGLGPFTSRPFWHRTFAIIPQGHNVAAATPQKYYDTGGHVYAIANLGGTPPQAVAGYSWGDYAVLMNGTVGGTAYPYRVWWSDPGQPESWTTGSSFFDMDDEVVGGMPLGINQLFWGYDRVWMLTGDTPPPGGNLAKRYLFTQGCMDARSLVNYRSFAFWANQEGVWKTDGTTLVDVTTTAGISLFWRALVKNFRLSQGWTAAAGIIHDNYYISISDNTGTHLTTLVYDIDRNIWYEHSNIQAAMYAERYAGPGTAIAQGSAETFFGHRAQPLVGTTSQLWLPDATNMVDGDGIAVQPQIETPFYKFFTFWHRRIIPAQEPQRFRAMWLGYDLRAPGGGAPYFTVEYAHSPEPGAAYTMLTDQPQASDRQIRARVGINDKGSGMGFRLIQVGQSVDTRLYNIQIEGHPLESSRTNY